MVTTNLQIVAISVLSLSWLFLLIYLLLLSGSPFTTLIGMGAPVPSSYLSLEGTALNRFSLLLLTMFTKQHFPSDLVRKTAANLQSGTNLPPVISWVEWGRLAKSLNVSDGTRSGVCCH